MKKLFLDDIRNPIDCCSYMQYRGIDLKQYHEEWDIVRNYKEFVEHINLVGLPDIISFDHDLADHLLDKDRNILSEKTGYDCAKWLIEYCMDNNEELPKFIVHSMNPVGTKNIKDLLNNFKQKSNETDIV